MKIVDEKYSNVWNDCCFRSVWNREIMKKIVCYMVKYNLVEEILRLQIGKGKGKNSLLVALRFNCPYKNNAKRKKYEISVKWRLIN